MDFFSEMEPLLRAFWFVAIPTSVIFIIQSVMTFMGLDAADGVEADFDSNLEDTSAPFQLFSLRNLINFLLGFSWTGISFYNAISSHFLLVGLAVAVGCLFVYVFFEIIRQVQKLAEDNSFKLTGTLNKSAQVYLGIPANKSGKGKILVSVKGSVHELDAMTENETKLESGTAVKVIRIDGDNTIIVAPI